MRPDPQPWKRMPPPPIYRDRDPMMPDGEPASWPVLAMLAAIITIAHALFWLVTALS